MPCNIWGDLGDRNPYFGRTGVCSRSEIVPLALISSYRLSTVNMSLPTVVWPQFANEVFGAWVSTRLVEKGRVSNGSSR